MRTIEIEIPGPPTTSPLLASTLDFLGAVFRHRGIKPIAAGRAELTVVWYRRGKPRRTVARPLRAWELLAKAMNSSREITIGPVQWRCCGTWEKSCADGEQPHGIITIKEG